MTGSSLTCQIVNNLSLPINIILISDCGVSQGFLS